MGFFGTSKKPTVGEAAMQSVVQTVVETKPTNPDAGKGNSKIVDFIILLVLGGLILFFVIWPLLMCYFFMLVCWIVLWPMMKFIPACGNHHWAAPAFRVLSVAVLSPLKLMKVLFNQWKGGDDDDAAAAKKKAEEEAKKKAGTSAAAAKPTTAPAPVVADKV